MTYNQKTFNELFKEYYAEFLVSHVNFGNPFFETASQKKWRLIQERKSATKLGKILYPSKEMIVKNVDTFNKIITIGTPNKT